MSKVPLGAVLNLASATRTLTVSQLASLTWRQTAPAYTSGAAYPWGNPPLTELDSWLPGYFFTQPPDASGAAWSGLPNEEAAYGNGPVLAAGTNPFSVTNGALVVQPRLLTPAEVATLPAALAGRKWLSGAAVTAPFCQAGGYFEFTAQLPPMQPGVWPAFWMLPVNGQPVTELDILEVVEDAAGVVSLTTSAHSNSAVSQTTTIPVTFDPATGQHRYGVWVAADYTTVFFDRVAVICYPTPPDFLCDWYLVFDLALAGIGGWDGPFAGAAPGALVISDVGAWSGAVSVAAAVLSAEAALRQIAAIAAPWAA